MYVYSITILKSPLYCPVSLNLIFQGERLRYEFVDRRASYNSIFAISIWKNNFESFLQHVDRPGFSQFYAKTPEFSA